MKKVFHFVKSNNFSGLENVVLNIITMVKGYDYTYVSPSGPIDHILKYFGIKHIVIPNMNPIIIKRIIKEYNPDIVQGHDPKVSVALSFSKHYCKKNDITMISQLHNDDPRMKKKFGIISILYLFSSFAFSKIISVSKDIIFDYSFNYFIKNKSVIIPNIINPMKVNENINKNKVIKKWDIAFLGRITYQKDPLKFINIVKKLVNRNNNIRAVIIGNGDLLNKSKALAKMYNINDNIDFLGFKNNPYKYLQKTKLLVITSRFEGFCLVALESLMVGTPVISTQLKVVKNIVDKKCGEFANSDDDFVNKIFYIIDNEKIYRDKSNYAKKKANKVNNISNFINLYKKIYH